MRSFMQSSSSTHVVIWVAVVVSIAVLVVLSIWVTPVVPDLHAHEQQVGAHVYNITNEVDVPEFHYNPTHREAQMDAITIIFKVIPLVLVWTAAFVSMTGFFYACWHYRGVEQDIRDYQIE